MRGIIFGIERIDDAAPGEREAARQRRAGQRRRRSVLMAAVEHGRHIVGARSEADPAVRRLDLDQRLDAEQPVAHQLPPPPRRRRRRLRQPHRPSATDAMSPAVPNRVTPSPARPAGRGSAGLSIRATGAVDQRARSDRAQAKAIDRLERHCPSARVVSAPPSRSRCSARSQHRPRLRQLSAGNYRGGGRRAGIRKSW